MNRRTHARRHGLTITRISCDENLQPRARSLHASCAGTGGGTFKRALEPLNEATEGRDLLLQFADLAVLKERVKLVVLVLEELGALQERGVRTAARARARKRIEARAWRTPRTDERKQARDERSRERERVCAALRGLVCEVLAEVRELVLCAARVSPG
jgi:hypothetical protein